MATSNRKLNFSEQRTMMDRDRKRKTPLQVQNYQISSDRKRREIETFLENKRLEEERRLRALE